MPTERYWHVCRRLDLLSAIGTEGEPWCGFHRTYPMIEGTPHCWAGALSGSDLCHAERTWYLVGEDESG